MKKRLLSLLLALVMVLGLCSTAFAAEGTDNFKQVNTYTAGQFTDVPAGQWYAPTVQRAYELGLMKGTGNGTTFSPNGNITIAETLALACRLHRTYYGNGAQFVQGAPWYQVYVDYAVKNGIIAAGDYTTYTAKATRADFVTILAAALPAKALPSINIVEYGAIPDIDYSDACYEAAYSMYRAGILTGSDALGTFKPDSNIMRSEVATIVVRMADSTTRRSITLTVPGSAGAGTAAGTYTYQDAVTGMSSNWNPHRYETSGDSYPLDFITSGLYSFIYNDELHLSEGQIPYDGYVVVPEMAAMLPIDVTKTVKIAHPEFNIPESVTSGYAYEIKLNPDACWDDGTPITADDYIASMERLLRPELLNYRASDYYDSDLCIAGARAYNRSNQILIEDNGITCKYTLDSLIKGSDGAYYTISNEPAWFAIDYPIDWLGGNTLADYVNAYGNSYFGMTYWATLYSMCDNDGMVPVTDTTIALLASVTTTNPNWGETDADLPVYVVYQETSPAVDFSTVGILKNDDYSITLVLEKALSGFQLLYNLSGNWLVKTDLYDSCLKKINGVWYSTYNTSVETTASYGPYVMTEYQYGSSMKFERNANWWGYIDGKHVYVDPDDGKVYQMYQTDVIETEVVPDAATRKTMFLKGDLMSYGLQTADFAQYRSSDYTYFTPSETIFFLILNGHEDSINNREAAADFDTATKDLQTMLLPAFRSAVAVTYDRDAFAATISPARSAGYGIIGSGYVCDPENGTLYRETDQAKQVLCNFYGVDVSKYASLDDAVDSISGYDPVLARMLYQQAFKDALAAGYITDINNDGISDQTVTIEYALSADSDFMTQTINYLNEKMAEVTKGTGFEGKIQFVKSAPYGNDWSNKIREGLSDTVLGGWSGSTLNPYSLTDLYVNPARAYDAAWFNAKEVNVTMNISGVDITMSLYDWSDALNGKTVVDVSGISRNFGEGHVDSEIRLNILAKIEETILSTGNYIPVLQDASAALLSPKVYYVVDEYNPVMGWGGIAYLRYRFNDEAWSSYVNAQGGTITDIVGAQEDGSSLLPDEVSPTETVALNAEQIYAKCASAVFYIEIYNQSGTAISSGSGVFISADGKALTNHHVVEDAYSAKIMTNDGKVYNVTGYYDAQEAIDMALIQVDGTGFPYLSIGDSTKIAPGQTVFAIGSPKGLDDTISQGIISNVNRVLGGLGYIQMTAPISLGSSGGALINDQGLLIGLNTAIYKDAQNINLAVPIHRYQELSADTVHPFPVGKEYSGASLTFSSSLDVTAGKSGVITISADPGNCTEAVTIYWDCADMSIAEPEWGEWDGWNIDLYVTGLAVGTTTVTISLETDAGVVLASEVLNVTVSNYSSACQTLANWVCNNATTVYTDKCVHYYEWPDGTLYGVTYEYSGRLTISQLYIDDTATVWAAFSIQENTQLFDCGIIYTWNETGDIIGEAYGSIDSRAYNFGDQLTHTYYYGNSAMEEGIGNLYHIFIVENIEWLRLFLDAIDIDVTLTDLGFTAYEYP